MAANIHKKRVSISEMMRVPSHKPKAKIGCRHIQVLIMTFGFASCYAVRITMSIALEAMTAPPTNYSTIPTYTWISNEKDLILSSFFWGYIITQIPGSMLAHYWNAQKLLSYSLLCGGFCTLAVPFVSKFGWEFVCASRTIAGLCQGVMVPTIHTLLSKWLPIEERGKLATFVYTGSSFGSVISLLGSGYLADSILGWPSCFYFSGGVTIISGLMYLMCGKETPNDHPSIPIDEKEYIEVSLGMTETTETPKTPWKAILTSSAVWALIITQAAHSWGFWMLLTKIPGYMGDALKFDIQNNGLMSSLPYLSAWLFGFPIGWFSDFLIERRIISTSISRKLWNTFGLCVPAVALIALGYVTLEYKNMAVVILTIAVATNVAVYCGYHVNHMDLSPNFAGTIMGIANTAANISSIMAPIVTGWLVDDRTDPLQWRNTFFLSAGIYFLGSVIFDVFGSGAVQRWNDPIKRDKGSVIYRIPEISISNNSSEQMEEKTKNTLP